MTNIKPFDFETYATWVRDKSTGNGSHFESGAMSPYASIEFPQIAAAVKSYEKEFPSHVQALKAHRSMYRDLHAQFAQELLAPGTEVRAKFRERMSGSGHEPGKVRGNRGDRSNVGKFSGNLSFGDADRSEDDISRF